jgi:hypothetical protein
VRLGDGRLLSFWEAKLDGQLVICESRPDALRCSGTALGARGSADGVSNTESQAPDEVEPGEPGSPGPRNLADEEQTRNRLAILNEFFKGMLLLNGGACLALLAFVQAIWERRPPNFLHVIVYGMAFFLAGLVFIAVSQYARYEVSLHSQFRRDQKAKRWRRAYGWLVALSVLAFVGGAVVILDGLYSAPPPATPAEITGRPQLPP